MIKDPKDWLDKARERVPEGYSIAEGGISRDFVFASAPVVLEGILEEEGGRGWLRLGWLAKWSKGWRVRRMLVDRGKVRASATLTSLASYGLNITSARAFDDYLQASAPLAPVASMASALGWSEDKRSFLWGEFLVTSEGVTPADPYAADPIEPGGVYLSHNIARAHTDGYEARGTWAGWLKAIKAMEDHPRALLAVYASAAAPVCGALGLPPFAIQWSGPASIGKSTCVSIAASAWGNPDPMADRSVVLRAYISPAEVAAAAAIRRHLPTLMDASGREKLLPAKIESALLANAITMSPGGDSMQEDDSLRSRLIALWGSPFGDQSPASARAISELREGVMSNFGHFGPALVERLICAGPEAIDGYRQIALEARARFAEKAAESGGLPAQLAEHIGTLAAITTLVHDLFPEFTWSPQPTMDDLWEWLALSAKQTGRATFGENLLAEYIRDNQDRVYGIRKEKTPPGNGWVGCKDREGRIWVVAGLVNDVLVDAGLRPMEVYREWVQTGTVVLTYGKYWRVVKMGARHVRAVALRTSPLATSE